MWLSLIHISHVDSYCSIGEIVRQVSGSIRICCYKDPAEVLKKCGKIESVESLSLIHIYRILRVNMANIRRKIEKNPAEPQYIFTEVGVGYRIVEPD